MEEPSPAPSSPALSSPGARRCSARLLSQSVQQTLRQLQKDEHKARVAELIHRNTIFYRRQKLCETVFSTSVLISFTIFSFYMVLSYGFEYFCTPNFSLSVSPRSESRRVGEEVTLMCSTSHPWEWCRWVHMAQYCEWEWMGAAQGKVVTGCTMQGVELVGNFSEHECGIRIGKLRPRDRGVWLCEIEKYHAGFGRRYGEVRYGQVTLGVVRSPNYRPPTTTITSTTISDHTEISTASQQELAAEADRVEEERIDERNFLILRVVVRSAVAITLVTLASMFAALFLHNYRQWELNIREKADAIANRDSEDDDEEDFTYDEIDPMLKKKLLQTRRKSVAFSVCVVDKDNMTFDLDRKKVLLGIPSTMGMSSDRLASLPPLVEGEGAESFKSHINVPLLQVVQGGGSRRGSRVGVGYHQKTGRRMSVPAVPLGGLGLCPEVRVKFGNSIETII